MDIFKLNGLSNLNEGEYTNFVLTSIENTLQYQEKENVELDKIEEIKF